MRTSFAPIVALAGLASAQQLNIAAINAAPLPATTAAPVGATAQSTLAYNSAAAATSATDDVQPTSAAAAANKVKRGDCSPQPAGAGPKVSPDTPEAFSNSLYFHALANSVIPPFPYIEKFRDLNGSTQQNSYLTYYILPSYDVFKCANYCNNVDLCTAFNLYVERDPSLDPGPNCPNPPSTTNYKCALWGSSISRASATSTGHVPAGFSLSAGLGNKAITLAGQFSLGSEFFAGPYDPSLCGFYATAQTSANRADAQIKGLKTYQAANSFNSYYVYKGNFAWGTYCTLFNKNIDSSYAGNINASSNGVAYGVGSSFQWSLTQQDAGTL
ncbi:hypothetical protein M409DRAFT_68596 [Zasmidium cellare ATCC 36951]|uniref:Apple domain-containing protein n=1 Tax=Zasmidium cellare ATCC 36951 TaxID=1080233 RepID=A0A6A6C853_ZASCE|nr:uncharacterized protein M409DRAFT_68596 [Zasmidium cellare ATCC 36951]KAF2163324.1 hypothetical protein M409DRAFT_68596 [Zasmidium cellare ATCC 36951]